MFKNPKHLVLAPLYWQQAKRIKRDTPRLPEALPLETENRRGVLPFDNTDKTTNTVVTSSDVHSENPTSEKYPYKLMIIGDSSAAGVGVEHQDEALIGQLLVQVSANETLKNKYSGIDWQLHATTGHDSFDVLRRLYVLPSLKVLEKPLDLLIVVVGVNDATKMQSLKIWQKNLNGIVTIANHKFKPKNIIFTALPPMADFPAMPKPINEFMGEKAEQLDNALEKFCSQHENIEYAGFDVNFNSGSHSAEYFAPDGFHPNGLTYRLWAEGLGRLIGGL